MYCKNCGKIIADNSLYCNYCGKEQNNETSTNDASNQNIINVTNYGKAESFDKSTAVNTKRKIKRSTILTISVVVTLIIAVIVGSIVGVINYRNSFNSSINKESFTYAYLINDDRIEVEISAVVDIRDFNFSIFCYRKDNIFHQYSKYFKGESINKGSTKKYTIMMSEIIKESPYLEKWKLDTVEISNYSGKIRNKDKK